MSNILGVFGAACLCLVGACATSTTAGVQRKSESIWPTLDGSPPLVIAHRGASGYLPEHTIEAYDLAIDQGADVIEPDLVFTKDGVLVARHDRYLSTTTEVADHPEFADRKRPNPDPNGESREDWWVEDFTLAELKTLRARQPREGRSTLWDGLYEAPTFEEVLKHVSMRSKEIGRPIGVYPETKQPGYFKSIGHDFEKQLLAALESFEAGPVFIQSFEPEILKRLKGKTNAKLVQLVYEERPNAGINIPLEEIAEYADGVGAPESIIFGTPENKPMSVTQAHELGIFVHVWTIRDDEPYLDLAEPLSPYGRSCSVGDHIMFVRREICYLFNMFVDGIFTDFPDTAHSVRDLYWRSPVFDK